MNDRSGQSLGTYRLVRLLGQGGFAEVYLGQHIHLNTQAAIKILLATKLNDETEMEGFRREAQIIASLMHSNIVRVLDFNIEQGLPFFVMEYAAQGSLRKMHKGSQLPLATITNYVRQVADALHYAHNRKQIHRDVKPDNILVRDDGSLMLSDFGIATIAHSSVSQHTEDMIGTMAYMAPEQMQGHPQFASDQYALAISAYEWLAGRLPFRGASHEIIAQHFTAAPPSLVEQLPKLSPAVEQVVFKALAKEAKERFASVQDFAQALERAEQGHSHQPALTKKIEPSARTPNLAPPTVKQIETIITHASDHTDKLRNSRFQEQSAALLLDRSEYWEKQGSKTFAQVVTGLEAEGEKQTDPAQKALSAYFKGLALPIIKALREGLLQVKTRQGQGLAIAWKVPNHCEHLLATLVPPARNERIWLQLLREFAQPPLHEYLTSAPLWPFHLWLLEQIRQLPQPQQVLAQITPWLDIPTWKKLEKVLSLDLPSAWVAVAITPHIQTLPRNALAFIQQHESIFLQALQYRLQEGDTEAGAVASNFFQSLVEYEYPGRVYLLLALANSSIEASFIDTLFSSIGHATAYRLDEQEIIEVLAGCHPGVLATAHEAQALAQYLQEFLDSLSPVKLTDEKIAGVLRQFNSLVAQTPVSDPLSLLIHWATLSRFINARVLTLPMLGDVNVALQRIFIYFGSAGNSEQVQSFAEEFIPMLVKRVKSEPDLEMVLNCLGKIITESRWDLLRWMAMLAGRSGPELAELLTYVLCGLREAENSHLTEKELANYLLALFAQQDRDIFKSIDKAVSESPWPDTYRKKWLNWRGLKERSLSASYFGNPVAQRAPEQQIPGLPASDNLAPVSAPLPEQSGYMPSTRQASHPGSVLASLPILNRSIVREEYGKIHQALPSLLRYWLSERIPADRADSKLLAFETTVLQEIKKDLNTSPTSISRSLVLYLAEDVLIEEVIKSQVPTGTIFAQELDPDRYLMNEFNNFLNISQETIISEASYKNGLRVLIRRYLVILQLETPKSNLKDVFGKNGLQAFLEKERRNIQLYV
ncbi:MAG TPA: serine/threonine-protein kinase [Ktedonobacteraceae bacterium]